MSRAVTAESLGAWLFKASPAEPETRAHLADGLVRMRSRCVRPSYRTDLVRPGQRVLLWVSGADPAHPAGVHAHGRVVGPVAGDQVPVALVPLVEPLRRDEVRADPDLAQLEVLRMPAGSNPSYATPAQLAALARLRPELLEG